MSGEAANLVDEISELAEAEATVSVTNIVEAIGDRGFGSLIFVIAIFAVTPVGGIPGFPTLVSIILVLIAFQILLGRKHIWLPSLVGERAVDDQKIEKSVDKARPVATWMDAHFGHRLEVLTGAAAKKAAAFAVIALCVLVPPLEFVPFAAIIPLFAIAMIGLALTVRDGVLMVGAFGMSALALLAALLLFPGG